MRSRYQLTPLAESDLEEIFFEVKDRHGLIVAERVYSNMTHAFAMLAEMPAVGRERPELWAPPYRFWPIGPAYIAYRADVRPIRIVRIARASRDWSRFAPG